MTLSVDMKGYFKRLLGYSSTPLWQVSNIIDRGCSQERLATEEHSKSSMSLFPSNHLQALRTVHWVNNTVFATSIYYFLTFSALQFSCSCTKICVYQNRVPKKWYRLLYISENTSICIKNDQYVPKILIHDGTCTKIFWYTQQCVPKYIIFSY